VCVVWCVCRDDLGRVSSSSLQELLAKGALN